MALLAFQKPVHAACLKHLRNQVRVPWVVDKELTIPIHPPMVVNASVSSGKSVLIGELTKETQLAAAMKNRAYHAMVLQNQSELCEQNSAAAFELGVSNSTFSASLTKSKYFPVIFGTTGTIARALETAFKEWAPDLLLIDECFPAWTQIDGKPISEINIGDMVWSFNHDKGMLERKPVKRLYRKQPQTLLTVIFESGKRIVCTHEHPFFVIGEGYIHAKKISNGSRVLRMQALPGSSQDRHGSQEKRVCERTHDHLLQQRVREEIEGCAAIDYLSANKSPVRFGQDESQQPDAQRGMPLENERDVKGYRPPPAYPDGEWCASTGDPGPITGASSGERFPEQDGTFGSCREGESKRMASFLSFGCGDSGNSSLHRSGRAEPWNFSETGIRSEEGRVFEVERVDRIEIHEPDDSGRYAEMHGLDTVYNFEVEGNNNYFADGILVHNCHTVPWDDPESQFMKIILHFYRLKPNMRVVGYTGSPFRSTDSIIGGYWNLFAHITPEDPLYPEGGIGNAQISTEFMSSTGWVVPCLFGWPEDESESTYDFSKFGVGDNAKDPTEAELDEAVGDIEKLQRICFEIVERTRERKGVLIFGATHRHLRQIKKCLINVGVEPDQIGSITERTKNKERKEILDRAKVGQCKFVLNVGVLTTGVNVPWWDTCCFLRPIASIVLLIQSIGRVLRLLLEKGGPSMVDMDSMTTEERLALIAASEKPDALVLDFGGVMDRLGALYDNPILEQAIKAHAEKKQETTQCPKCDEVNSIFARRCIGYPDGLRCEHFFKSRICPGCGVENDPVARSCRACNYLLLDPNASLNHKAYSDEELTPVVKRTIKAGAGGSVLVRYLLADGREPFQIYHPGVGSSDQMRKINTTVWRNQFAFKCVQSEEWKFKAGNMKAAAIEKMQAMFSVPTHISARQNDKGKWNIGRMVFRDSGLIEVPANEQIEEGEIA